MGKLKEKYKPTDKVTIIRPGHFKDLQGEVISVGDSSIPIKVDLGQYGSWNFKATEIELTKVKTK